jgi:putative nucleotidyltransferase with HDIG domain
MNSLTPSLKPDDYQLIDSYLDEPGKFLFFQMGRIDRHHAIAVARAIITDERISKQLNRDRLIKAALLHDIGKVQGDFNFLSRLMVGFIRRFTPTLRGKLALTQPNTFWQRVRYSFYVDLVHPARGAHMARIFGIDPDVVEMIRHHHDPPGQNQSPELTWLQLADNRN